MIQLKVSAPFYASSPSSQGKLMQSKKLLRRGVRNEANGGVG
jgi:hypothetical protein